MGKGRRDLPERILALIDRALAANDEWWQEAPGGPQVEPCGDDGGGEVS